MSRSVKQRSARGSRTAGLPLSLRLPAGLRQRVRRFAAVRALQEATAIRMLCAERLEEIELEDEVRAAEGWQLRQAITTWDDFRSGKGRVVRRAAIDRVFAEARAKRPRTERVG